EGPARSLISAQSQGKLRKGISAPLSLDPRLVLPYQPDNPERNSRKGHQRQHSSQCQPHAGQFHGSPPGNSHGTEKGGRLRKVAGTIPQFGLRKVAGTIPQFVTGLRKVAGTIPQFGTEKGGKVAGTIPQSVASCVDLSTLSSRSEAQATHHPA